MIFVCVILAIASLVIAVYGIIKDRRLFLKYMMLMLLFYAAFECLFFLQEKSNPWQIPMFSFAFLLCWWYSKRDVLRGR